MGLRIIYGKAGTGKSTYCFSEIANIINKEKKIYIITPEQFSFTAEKKLMETVKENAVFNAEVITFNRLVYRILGELGGAYKGNLTKCGRAMLVYSILNNNKKSLKFLGKTDENIDLCLNAITEFKKHGINTEILKEEIEKSTDTYLKTKIQDLNLVYENFENQILGKYIDETDLLTMLAENLDKSEMLKDSLIYIDEFMGFTNQEYEIIKKMIKIAKQVSITICTEDLNLYSNPDTDIFYSNKLTLKKIMDLLENKEDINKVNLNECKRFKSKELKHLEENLYANKYNKFNDKPENLKLFLAKNQYSEIENIAKQISLLVREEKYRYKDISVITKNIETYSSLIRAIFNKYEIPVFIDEKRDLNQNIVIQYILSILEIFNKNWSYESVFNYIKTGFVDIDENDMFKLEKYCLKWGIKNNKWKRDFEIKSVEEKDKPEVKRLNEIRREIVDPLIELKKILDSEKTAEGISKAIYQFLINQDFEIKLANKIKELENIGLVDISAEYKSSYKIVLDILDEIVLVFKDEKLSFDKYINLLKVGLKNSGLTKIPGTNDQVIVGDVERSRSHKVRAIFIIGLNDGVFPSVNKDEGFLNDEDREILKQDGIELAKGTIDKLYEDNFNIYKAFTTAEEKLYLSYSSSDSSGKSLRPSVLINKIKKIFVNITEESDIVKSKSEIINKKTTYDELIINISRLKSGEDIDKIWYAVYNYYNNSETNEKLEQNLMGLNYTNLPEQLSKENIDKLYGDTISTSVSKLEKYRSCPFSYYLQYGLRLKEKEELKMQSLNTGTFMHEVIDAFFDRIKEKEIQLSEIEEDEIKEIVDVIVEEKLTLNKNYIFTSTAKYKLLVARLKRILSKALKYIVETLVQSQFEVLGTEMEFGDKGDYKPIILTLENGKKVEITGKIDRVDIAKSTNGNYLRIIDYKSSAKSIDFNKVYAGLQIQLITYLDAVCKVEDLMPAGILYFGLLEQKVEQKIPKEEIEEKIKERFKMNGVILADVNVVKMHDKTLTSGYSKLVPAYIDKNGNLGKKTNGVTKEQFEDLQNYIYKTIKEIAKEILGGKIDLKPYYKKGETPCKFCEYKSICNFKSGMCKNEYNYIGSKSKDEILFKIKNN